MKVICKKENDASKMLELVKQLLETEYAAYPLLKEDLVLELSLKDTAGQSYFDNEKVISFEEKDLQQITAAKALFEYYYNTDALTKLFNRGKYEQDIVKLQADCINDFTCIYIDAVGLHEINNHLGHAAGDRMLCTIADGIRRYFPHCPAYRIGGDEFVIFCFHQKEASIMKALSQLKFLISPEKYEISIGMKRSDDGLSLTETIDCAEEAMRDDKAQFYLHNGGERQMRSLNHKLEKILLEKQDTSQFLNVIAAEYKGVYMVNPNKDTCRYIYIPEYFKELLKKNNGKFSDSIHMYCNLYVAESYQADFRKILDYNYVLAQIKCGNQIKFTYLKKDGSKIHLQITIYDQNSSNTNEMLWIFMDGDL